MNRMKIVARTALQKRNRAAARNARGPIAKRYMATLRRPSRPEGDLSSQ